MGDYTSLWIAEGESASGLVAAEMRFEARANRRPLGFGEQPDQAYIPLPRDLLCQIESQVEHVI